MEKINTLSEEDPTTAPQEEVLGQQTFLTDNQSSQAAPPQIMLTDNRGGGGEEVVLPKEHTNATFMTVKEVNSETTPEKFYLEEEGSYLPYRLTKTEDRYEVETRLGVIS